MGDVFTKEEYLALIEELAKEQYDSDYLDEDAYMPSEWPEPIVEIRKKELQPNTNGQIDLTAVKAGKIKEELFKCANLKVGNFKIRISRYNGVPSSEGSKIAISLRVFEERHKTPSGAPCKIDFPMAFEKDSRFAGQAWVKYFIGSTKGNAATNVPVDTVVDIVRWFQALIRMGAFL